jgi:hypothetical protein
MDNRQDILRSEGTCRIKTIRRSGTAGCAGTVYKDGLDDGDDDDDDDDDLRWYIRK